MFRNTKNIKFSTNHDVKIVHYIKNKGYNVKTLDSKESLINRLKHDKPNKIYNAESHKIIHFFIFVTIIFSTTKH